MEAQSGQPGRRLQSHVLQLDRLAPEDRFDAAFDFYSSVMDIFVPPERRRLIIGKVTHWELGSLLLLDGMTDAITILRSHRHIARDDLDHWLLRVTRNGRLISRTEDRSYSTSDGGLVLETLAEPFSDDWTDASWVTVIMPREAMPEITSYFAQRGTGPVRGASAALLADFLVSLADRLPGADEADRDRFSRALHGMISACLQVEVRPEQLDGEQQTLLARERVLRVIRGNLGSARLDPDRICALAGLSRSALYRMFEAQGGVAHFVQLQRLDRVFRDLTDVEKSGMTIASIAEQRGFHNTTAFNRAFRRQFGCTPGDVRTAAMGGTILSVKRSGNDGPDRLDLFSLLT